MTDVLNLLPPFEYKGRKYPVTARTVGFSHENVQHKLQYRAGELVEQTGPRNWTFSYTLPMREGVAKGPYKDLFSGGLPQLVRDIRDRSAGPLIDPIHGEFIVVPTSFSDEADPLRRDGTDIRVEFVHAPELEDEDPAGNKISLAGLSEDAGAMDEEIAAADWEQEPSPEGATDILSGIAGAFSQIDRQVNKVSAALDDLAFRAEKVEAAVDKVENPQNWPLRRSARRVRETALRIKRRGDNPTRRIRTIVQRFQTTLTSVAAETGMTVQELIRLNPELVRLPFVPAGAVIRAPA